MDFLKRSIDIILEHQHASGAYVACPNFPTYQYCWFRDGSFIAYSMDLVDQFESAHRFHAWAAGAVNQRIDVIKQALESSAVGREITEAEVLHTRYTLEGQDGTREEWPNFQLDGFGTWLWALNEHRMRSRADLPAEWVQAASAVASYLEALWRLPCYDCWEEFPDKVHPHTLAAIYGGLRACQDLDGKDRSSTLAEIEIFIFEKGLVNGHFAKFAGSETVDASLLALCTPYRLVRHQHPVMLGTISEIERLLHQGGGVHRYAADTYYGGGEWVLLAGWLGWYYAESGQISKAQSLLTWMENSASETGGMPEQVPTMLNDPEYYQPWLERWGAIATPLLWSHANYIILRKKLE
ncbi:MAG: glycoside hydrolase family 15 protein [Chloroflexi bacterium]|nr:glycoside hydrolase family 15 protein [Chloroflexota bacterium]